MVYRYLTFRSWRSFEFLNPAGWTINILPLRGFQIEIYSASSSSTAASTSEALVILSPSSVLISRIPCAALAISTFYEKANNHSDLNNLSGHDGYWGEQCLSFLISIPT